MERAEAAATVKKLTFVFDCANLFTLLPVMLPFYVSLKNETCYHCSIVRVLGAHVGVLLMLMLGCGMCGKEKVTASERQRRVFRAIALLHSLNLPLMHHCHIAPHDCQQL